MSSSPHPRLCRGRCYSLLSPVSRSAVQVRITSCVPVPESNTDCGLPVAVSVMVSEAVRAPEAKGVNDMTMVQVPPAATEEPQVLFSVKSAGSAPVKAILVMLKAVLPVLSRVTD